MTCVARISLCLNNKAFSLIHISRDGMMSLMEVAIGQSVIMCLLTPILFSSLCLCSSHQLNVRSITFSLYR